MAKVRARHSSIATIEAELIKSIRAGGGMSRVELSRVLNLAPSTAGIYADRLVKEHFLNEARGVAPGFGRPPTVLTLNPRGGRFIGVDHTAGHIFATVVDFAQQPLNLVHHKTKPGETVEKILTRIDEAIESLMGGDDRPVLGIGVGVPGSIDPKRGVVLHYAHIPGWTDVPLVERLTKRFGVPVHIENNIRAMALAELWFGQGRGVEHFICIGVRTGIAAGLVVDGHLHRGANSLAGEIGGWPCPFAEAQSGNEFVTNPNSEGVTRLEQVASIPAILDQIQKALHSGVRSPLRSAESPLSIEAVTTALHSGDPLAMGIVGRAAAAVGTVAVQLSLAFNPAKIILAGPVASFGSAFLKPMKSTMQRLAPALHSAVPEVIFSEQGEFVGAIGAAALAVHEWKPAR